MKKIKSKDLIKQYYEEVVKEKYPDISFKIVEDVCKFVFKFTKRIMENNTLMDVRLKYFGIFTTYPGRIIAMYNRAEKHLKKGYITEERYFEIKYTILQHIKTNPEKFKDHKDKISKMKK